ncbi:MAG: hypothetical protein ACPK85_08445 [Methanosarcina sp.]
MKISKVELREIIGMFVGVGFWYLCLFLVVTASGGMNISSSSDQIINWIFTGLFILFMILGHYIFSSDIIDEKNRIEDIVGIKSNLIGYFLWLILMVFAYLLNIEISSNASIIGGYTTIFLIFLYMRNRAFKTEREFTYST